MAEAARVIDAHQHFWDPARADYPWMAAEALAPLRRAFGPEDLLPQMHAAGVDASIVVQARHDLAETEDMLAIAARHPSVLGVVGWVDLTAPDVAVRIARLLNRPDGRYLVGIRHQVHDEPDPDWLLQPDVQRGIAAVVDAGLTFDLLVRKRELPAATAIVSAFPAGRFVLDHVAKPPIAAGPDPEWTTLVSHLAALPNVWCKLSGLVTEANWTRWTPDDLGWVIRHALVHFGAGRLVFGSDWPVCLLAAQYREVKEALESHLAELAPSAREAILGGNAFEAYGLKPGRDRTADGA